MVTVALGIPTQVINLSDAIYWRHEQIYLRTLITGDSIYKGVTNNTENSLQAGLRQEFVQLMAVGGYRVDMVGPFEAGPPTFRQKQHAALSGRQIGYGATNIASWIATYDPDVVVAGFGINNALQPLNDDGSPKTEADILGTPAEMGDFVDQIHGISARIWVVVPTLTPVNGLSSGLSVSDGLGDSYRSIISAGYRTEVAARVALGQRVVLAELSPAMTYAHISDGVHPNSDGYTLMAQRISDALITALNVWQGDTTTRSPILVTTAAGSGTLTLGITAGHGNIESITVEGLVNATSTFPAGGASATWPRRYVPGSPTATVPVTLTQQTATDDMFARLVVIDDRGPWPVLVGAGAEAL